MQTITPTTPLFPLGRILATPGAIEALVRNETSGAAYLSRHVQGDWSECGPEDAEANRQSVEDGSRVFGVYSLPDKTKVWIITEAVDDDGRRVATTILLPEEY
jgi:hypothetical protein